jgi:FkbM family methyltransferase
MYKALFAILAPLGRPFGGIRPRRITHWIARKAYGDSAPTEHDFRWHRDRFGNEFLLHPHFAMHYEIIAFGLYDPYTSNYIAKHVKPGMVCADIGANFGIMSVHMGRRVGSSGKVFSVEPVPSVMARFRENIERNRLQEIVQTFQMALSNQTGTVTMRVADENTSNQAMSSLTSRSPLLVKEISVPTMTFDDFVAQQKITRLDLLKIDIQGSESSFLQGAAASLRALKPDVLMEFDTFELADAGVSGRDLMARVIGLGYEVFTISERGTVGERIDPGRVRSDFAASSVLCRPER